MSTLRITNSSITNRFLTNVQAGYQALAGTQEQIATGQRVNRPSDDPLAAAEARLRQVDLDQIASAKRSASAATAWLGAQETGLAAVTDVLQRANELTVQGANGSYNQDQRNSIALEIDQLVQRAKQAMNGRSGEAYVFSGTATGSAPYAAGSDAYLGDENAVMRDLGQQTSIQVNPQLLPLGSVTPVPLTAKAILGEGGSPTPDGRVLDTLERIAANLRAGNVAALGTTDLSSLKRNLDTVGNARAAVGAAQNRVDTAVDHMDAMSALTTGVLGDLTGTDFAQAVTNLQAQQNAYVAALRSGATIVQTSLMDFLR